MAWIRNMPDCAEPDARWDDMVTELRLLWNILDELNNPHSTMGDLEFYRSAYEK